ncbi:MAG: type IV pilus twitching motility protein PilT [Gemmatimonadales bacterium]
MEKIIKAAVQRGASDLLIKAGDVFRARIDGVVVPFTKQRLTPEQTRAIAAKLIGDEDGRTRLDKIRDFDCSWGMPGVGRFRVNVLRQRSSMMIVMRVIPFDIPTLEDLRLPGAVTRLAEADSGLVIVSGITGSGKTSTIAAMIHHVNRNLQKHVVTIESPIEFLHRDINSSVTQREVGVDTASSAQGLNAALRQDPDVIVAGELADPVTLDLAIKGAEMGHLVIGVLTTPDVTTTLSRVLAMFPREERQLGRLRLSDSLLAVTAQRLLARKDGEGRVAVMEILFSNDAVREVVKEPNRLTELHKIMDKGGDEGMQTFEGHAEALVKAGDISKDVARVLLARGGGH